MRLFQTTRAVPLLCTLAVIFFALQVFSDNKADVDIWGNVGFVRALPWSQGYHYTNTFSFTEPDYRWVNHEWLGEYILNRTYTGLGNPGLLLLKLALGFSLLGLIYRAVRLQTQSAALRFLYMMLTISTIGYGFSMRPHHFTYLMLAGLLSLLAADGPVLRSVRFLGAVTLGALLWANLHGAFFMGIPLLVATAGLTAAVAIRRPDRRQELGKAGWLLGAAAVFFVASLVNPYGIGLWGFVFESAAHVRTYLSEWAPFNPARDFFDHVDFLVLAALTLLSLLVCPRKGRTTDAGLLALAFTAALVLRRNIPLFAIVAAFTAVRYVDAAIGRQLDGLAAKFPKFVTVLLLAAFLPVSLGYTLWFNKERPTQIEVPADQFPVETIAFLRDNAVKGNAIVFFNWAEQCIWHLYPAVKVFLDGRFRSAYNDRTIETFLAFFYDGTRWDAALTDYPTDMVLIHRSDVLYDKMLARPGWTLVHSTPIAALFMKDSVHAASYPALRPVPYAIEVPLFP